MFQHIKTTFQHLINYFVNDTKIGLRFLGSKAIKYSRAPLADKLGSNSICSK